MDIRGETGAVIPDFKEVGRHLKAKAVDQDLEVGIEVFGFFGGLAKEVLECLFKNRFGKEIFVSVDGTFGRCLHSAKVIDKAKPLIERTVGKFDFEFTHRSGAKVGTQEAHAKSGADVGDEMFEAAFGVPSFGGVFAPLFEDCLEDEVVKTTADEKLVDQFEFNPVFAVIFCRIDDKRNWTKWDGIAVWVEQNGVNWLR